MKIIQDPVKTAVTVFVIITLIVFAITFLKIDFFQNRTIGYYSSDFWQNILVEAHGMLFDLLIIGVLILWLDKKRDKANEVDKYCNEIDDFRDWKDDEAKYRIVGNLAKMEIAKAMNASLIKIWRLRRRAKKYYKKIGKRSDGMPLSKDDIDKLFQD